MLCLALLLAVASAPDAGDARQLERACQGGRAAACTTLADRFSLPELEQRAYLLRARACHLGDTEACISAAWAGYATLAPDKEVAALLALACRRKDARGCYGAGQVALRRLEVRRAERFFRELCSLAPKPRPTSAAGGLFSSGCEHTLGEPECPCPGRPIAPAPVFPEECVPALELACSRGDEGACAEVEQMAQPVLRECVAAPGGEAAWRTPGALCQPGQVLKPGFQPAREARTSLESAAGACAPEAKRRRLNAIFDGSGGFVDLRALDSVSATGATRACIFGRVPPPGSSRWISWPPPQGALRFLRLTIVPRRP